MNYFTIILGITFIASYLTHIFWVFGLAMSEASINAMQVVVAIFGTIIPPLGLIHGFYLWIV